MRPCFLASFVALSFLASVSIATAQGSERARSSEARRASDDDAPVASTMSETPSRDAPREAVELFQRAREHYHNGRYAEAAADLESALVLDPGSPTLLYNLGRVYELAGDLERAIDVYRRYLPVIPSSDAAERDRTQAAIRRLEGAREY